MPDNVVRPRGLLKFIKAHKRVVFTPREMENIINSIEHARYSKSFKMRKEHVDNLKANKNKKSKGSTQYKSENLICPRCGNDLVIRTAKRGQNVGNQFYGCKSYPRCKYTRKLN